MPIHIKQGGSWQTTRWHYNNGGSWTTARVYLKVNGSWVPVSSEIIDNFEDGDRGGWTVPSSTGSDSVISPGLDGSDFKWEMSGFREGHLAGADAVDRGPQPGDTWEFWFQITETSGDVISRLEFSADGTDDDDMYRIEWERETGDNELSLEKYSGGSQELIDTDPNFAPGIGFIYRCEVQWNAGNNDITCQMFLDGSPDSAQLSISDSSSGEFAQPGIHIFNSGNNVCEYDEIRITDSG